MKRSEVEKVEEHFRHYAKNADYQTAIKAARKKDNARYEREARELYENSPQGRAEAAERARKAEEDWQAMKKSASERFIKAEKDLQILKKSVEDLYENGAEKELQEIKTAAGELYEYGKGLGEQGLNLLWVGLEKGSEVAQDVYDNIQEYRNSQNVPNIVNDLNIDDFELIPEENEKRIVEMADGFFVSEYTIKQPMQFNINDELMTVSQYRSIILPEMSPHDMEVSLSCSQLDGKRPKSSATYLIVKYNEYGKINYLSLPNCPAFTCEGKKNDPIFVTNNKIIYTLPINSAEYFRIESLIEANGGIIEWEGLEEAPRIEPVVEVSGDTALNENCTIQ